MKITLTNPPAYIGDEKRHFIQAGSRWSFSIYVKKNFKEHYLPYPFSLGYSLALLKQNPDMHVKGLDSCALDFNSEQFVKSIITSKPDILLIDVPTISFPLVMDILKEIKSIVETKIVLAGGHVTALAESIMTTYDFIDYCLLGEYTLNLQKLVEHLHQEANVADIRKIEGLAYRDGGTVVVNQMVPQRFNLDDLPYPDREDFPIELYHDFDIAGRPCVQMLTSLGCPYKCSFCMPARVIYGDTAIYRKRQPVKIVDEMIYAQENYHCKQVYFDDETFAVDKGHVKAIAREIMNRRLDLPWTAMGDITLDRESLEEIRKAGCVGLKFGVETANVDACKSINKGFVNLEKVERFVKWCRELDIWSHATYIIGLPGDNKQSIEKTIEFAKRLNTDSVQFSIATPFPGTPFFKQAEENGWLVTYDWTQYDGANYSVLSYPWLTKDEIEKLHKRALKGWYWNAMINEIKRPSRVARIIKAGSTKYAVRKTLSHLRGRL